MFARLIWIASASSVINIRLLLYFETETTGLIERHSKSYIVLSFFFFLCVCVCVFVCVCLYVGAIYSIQLSMQS